MPILFFKKDVNIFEIEHKMLMLELFGVGGAVRPQTGTRCCDKHL